jgi:hypothetical protein
MTVVAYSPVSVTATGLCPATQLERLLGYRIRLCHAPPLYLAGNGPQTDEGVEALYWQCCACSSSLQVSLNACMSVRMMVLGDLMKTCLAAPAAAVTPGTTFTVRGRV